MNSTCAFVFESFIHSHLNTFIDEIVCSIIQRLFRARNIELQRRRARRRRMEKKNKKTMRKMLKHEIYCEDGYHQSTFAVLERAAAEIELFM